MQGTALQDNCPFLGARKERKEHPPSPRPRFLGGVDVVAFGSALPAAEIRCRHRHFGKHNRCDGGVVIVADDRQPKQ